MKFYGDVPKALSVKIHRAANFSQDELNKKNKVVKIDRKTGVLCQAQWTFHIQ
jgi:hypothetical protein